MEQLHKLLNQLIELCAPAIEKYMREELQTADPPKMVSLIQGSEIVHLSTRTLRRLTKKGIVPSIQPNGRNHFYIESELIEAVKNYRSR